MSSLPKYETGAGTIFIRKYIILSTGRCKSKTNPSISFDFSLIPRHVCVSCGRVLQLLCFCSYETYLINRYDVSEPVLSGHNFIPQHSEVQETGVPPTVTLPKSDRIRRNSSWPFTSSVKSFFSRNLKFTSFAKYYEASKHQQEMVSMHSQILIANTKAMYGDE